MKILWITIGLILWITSIMVAADVPTRKSLDELLNRVVKESQEGLQRSQALADKITKDSIARQVEDKRWAQEDEERWYSVSSKNFIVSAIGKSYAKSILTSAEKYRKELAPNLKDGDEVIQIHVQIVDVVDNLTLVAGPGTEYGGNHRIWLHCPREQALDNGLRVELQKIYLRQPGDPNPSRTSDKVPIDIY